MKKNVSPEFVEGEVLRTVVVDVERVRMLLDTLAGSRLHGATDFAATIFHTYLAALKVLLADIEFPTPAKNGPTS